MIRRPWTAPRQQPHLHLLISARQNDAHARTAATHFKRYNRAHPERGGAEKDPAFWHKGAIKAHRVLISDVVNVHLEYAGLAARVHPDSSRRAPGWTASPSQSCSPARAARTASRGSVSPRMQEVLDIRQAAGVPGREGTGAGSARIGKDGRANSGSRTRSPWHTSSTRSREARAQRRDHPPVARQWWTLTSGGKRRSLATASRRSIIRQTQKSYGNVAPKNQVRFRTEREAQQAGYRRAANDHYGPGTGVARTATRAGSLAGEFQRLTRLMDPEDGRGHGDLNVRLHDEERERDRGMSW